MANKKQLSILLFALQRPCVSPPPEASDLTRDPDHESVACPVCSIPMAQMAMESRILHVEECLSMLTIKEEPLEVSTTQARVTHAPNLEIDKQEDKSDGPLRIEKSDSQASDQGEQSRKKRKLELSASQKEVAKYVNKDVRKPRATRTSTITEEEGPLELLPSSRKIDIPDLKTLTFQLGDARVHQVSMDAFCFKPHDSIKQYFLSHFHSDHYGGMTKRWCRERTIDSKIIYCSPITARLLNIKFSVDPNFIFPMELHTRYMVYSYEKEIQDGGHEAPSDTSPGLYVTTLEANHCPGAVIFLFESILGDVLTHYLHCGDFRINREMIAHPLLLPFLCDSKQAILDRVYLDTTYMSPKYNFPKQEKVCDAAAELFERLISDDKLFSTWFGSSLQSRITDFFTLGASRRKKKFLVLVGTYLIGKEKLAIAILKRLNQCPIYVSNISSRGEKGAIVRAYEDPYLNSVLTDDELGGTGDITVHLVPMKIVGTVQEMSNYFNHNGYFEHFERCVGLRPTGWSFRGNDDDVEPAPKLEKPQTEEDSPIVENEYVTIDSTVSVLKNCPDYTFMDILRQNVPPRSASKFDKTTFRIYSLPYSEHLSYRELSYFVVFLNINLVIPTVNTENTWSVLRMEEIIRNWETIRECRMSGHPALPPGLQERIKNVTLADF